MSEIHLPGLLAREPAGALASFGLYSLFPEATLRWERSFNTHYPVLKDGVAGLEHLKRILLDPKTWSKLMLPPTGEALQGTQCTVADYDLLYKSDSVFAQGLGCDHLITHHKTEGLVVRRTPFYGLYRQDKFAPQVGRLISVLKKQGEKVTKALTDPTWKMFPGPNFAMFPSLTPCKAFKSPAELRGKRSGYKSRTVPLVTLLALAGWRLFPTYKLGRRVLTTGWVESTPELTNGVKERLCWVYPVFSRPVRWGTFLTWAMHPKLKRYRKHTTLWNTLGIDAVYCAGFDKVAKGCYMMLYGEQL